ncbi:hypothetical protein R1sor_026248 [Riccia sorocarpa]|uniref:Leucine-rich repeat-containing N-terminal plant-type domain-containing protein n=1 Tax=Riccia sorocarpa TaxID=122646 RepID=A0ABD3GE54_9MARC
MDPARLLALLLLLLIATEETVAQTCNPRDSDALLYFADEIATSGPTFKTWIPGSNCCQWDGIVCNSAGSVVSLIVGHPDIPTISPSGQDYVIASSLGSLDDLEVMNITNMGLPGSLSPTMGTLSKLQTMYIDGCNVVGAIPDSLCNLVALKTLVMRNNLFTSYPDCFKNRPSITTFDFTGNKFDAGDVPKRPLLTYLGAKYSARREKNMNILKIFHVSKNGLHRE